MQTWYAAEKNEANVGPETVRDFDAVLEATGMGIVVTDNAGIITHFNKSAEKLFGYLAKELIGRTTPHILHDSSEILDRAREGARPAGQIPEPVFATLIERKMGDSNTYSDTWIFVRKDKSRFSGHMTLVALRDSNQQLKGYVGIIRDLTETENLRAELANSQAQFHLLAENIPGAVYLCNIDETFSLVFLNQQAEAITGYTREEFYSGKVNFAMIMHPDDQKKVPENLRDNVTNTKGYERQYRLRHKSGEWRWVRDSGIGIYHNGALKMLEGFVQDITAEKEAEEKLIRIADENLRFFNNPVTLNVVADADGYLLRVSPSCHQLLGWSDEELKAEPVQSFVHEDDLESLREALRQFSSGEKVDTFESRFRCKNGSYRWLLWGCVPDPETKIAYCSAIDISARKQSEENILNSKSHLETLAMQLQAQNRKLDEFAHIVSHNLRAPANNIQALINLLSPESSLEDYKLIFEKLKNVSKNLSETMNELLDNLHAKSDAETTLSEIRFSEVLAKVVQSLEGDLIIVEASVTYNFNEAPTVRFPKSYLESIFQNLLTNAIKYRSPDRTPTIHFVSSRTDRVTELKVIDNGLGIDLDRFGDKLFGLHQTFHNHHDARGVGLFLVKNQIESLGGSISVVSEVDKGTTFIIRFSE